ncbi:shikimate dehydrogenase [Devosia sp. CN2-171]|uniref:shikimate dehydrogenase n=1 Tax=Devosia sp. CN2-171 TaxID=3400909 RepID=UPI003BF7ED4C
MIHVKKAFVIGHPIRHSRSPLIHGTWLAEHAIAGSYDAIDVAPDDLAGFVGRVRAGEFVGGNVTIPHKEEVFRLCDSIDPLAETIGAVNTLVREEGGRIRGFNTDYMGFLGNLDQNAPGWSVRLGRAIVLGAGGAARAILVALRERGFKEIVLLNRTPEKAEALAREIDGPFTPGRLSDFAFYAGGADLLVNTTSIGMHESRFDDLDLGLLPETALVTDIVYVPLMTPLLADARAVGVRTVDGLGMLLHQAVPGFEAWFGVRPEVTAELRQKVEATL